MPAEVLEVLGIKASDAADLNAGGDDERRGEHVGERCREDKAAATAMGDGCAG